MKEKEFGGVPMIERLEEILSPTYISNKNDQFSPDQFSTDNFALFLPHTENFIKDELPCGEEGYYFRTQVAEKINNHPTEISDMTQEEIEAFDLSLVAFLKELA